MDYCHYLGAIEYQHLETQVTHDDVVWRAQNYG